MFQKDDFYISTLCLLVWLRSSDDVTIDCDIQDVTPHVSCEHVKRVISSDIDFNHGDIPGRPCKYNK